MFRIKSYLLNIKAEKYNTLSDWIEKLKEFQLDSLFETRILARAYEYINSVEIVIDHENTIEAAINTTNIYKITLTLQNNVIHGECSCPYDGNCKHIAAVILCKKSIEY